LNQPSCKLSVVSPVYGAEDIVDELVRRVREELGKLDLPGGYEIILVEDGSPDHCWDRIMENCERHREVRGIKLSRNFGQHAAIEAGLANATGDHIVVMDCDLQEDPAYIGVLLDKARQGHDVVFTSRGARNYSPVKNFTAWLFRLVGTALLPKSGRVNYDLRIGTMSLISPQVARAFQELGDFHKPYTAILGWLGFNAAVVEIEHRERFSGKSSYGYFRLLMHALNGIIVYSERPLYISVFVGFVFVGLSTLYGLVILFRALFMDAPATGWASLITAVVFTSGVVLVNLGISSLYLGKVFQQAKGRPRYVIDRNISAADDA